MSRAGRALPWVVLVVLLVGFGVYEFRLHRGGGPAGSDGSDDAPAAMATPTASGVDGVVVGDLPVTGGCYETHAGGAAGTDVTPLPKPCDGLHNTYVVAQQKYTEGRGAAYDEQQVADEGKDLCRGPSRAYVGTATASFTFVSIYPSRDSWAGGDRTVACLVRREGADVVGPLTQ